MSERSERALEKFHFSSILCSFIVVFSSNDMLKWNTRASERLRNSDFPWIWFIFLAFYSDFFEFPEFLNNFLLFPQISLKFLKLLEFLEKFLENSLYFAKTRENSLKVEALNLPQKVDISYKERHVEMFGQQIMWNQYHIVYINTFYSLYTSTYEYSVCTRVIHFIQFLVILMHFIRAEDITTMYTNWLTSFENKIIDSSSV